MKPTSSMRRALWLALLAGLGLSAALFASCGNLGDPRVTPTPTRTPRPTATLTPSPTPTPVWPVTLFVPQDLPAPLRDALDAALESQPGFFALVPSAAEAEVQVTLDPGAEAAPLAEWVYAVAAPFPTLADEVAWADVTGAWAGEPTGPFAGRPLLATDDVAATLRTALGEPAPGAVELVAADEIVRHAWDTRPAWAVVPFDQLEPRWKVLRVDGVSTLDQELDTAAYPLVVRVAAAGLDRGVSKLQELVGAPLTNRDPAKMSVVALTGVTALGRCTAATMDSQGVLYPGQSIRDWLLEPDITHISNEVSFAQNCEQSCTDGLVVFCSRPSYIELFEDLDVDVIELTGNHLLDWGVGALVDTLHMYDERGIPYFGGGWNTASSRVPLTLTHGVHTFGFVGCDTVPGSGFATADQPGAAECVGYDYTWMIERIAQLRAQGIIPIVTLQYWEFDQFEPTPQQRADFRELSQAGAVIVSGSQAHHPQAFDFQGGAFIHYGLGNLFFDQTQMLAYRQTFVDRHVFYDGRHLSTELLTAQRDDYAQPRPMTDDERRAFLQQVFQASGW